MTFFDGSVCQTNTMRDGSRYGSGRSRTPSSSAKTALLTPMPSASVSTTSSVNPGRPKRIAAGERDVAKQQIELQGLAPEKHGVGDRAGRAADDA